MSRWYLTSSKAAAVEASSANERANLRVSGEVAYDGCYGRTYFKRAIATSNFVDLGEDGFICSAGTLIYDGQIGAEALRHCYNAFIEGGAHAIQAHALGHYAVAVKHLNALTIFTDPLGAFNLYYFNIGSFWFASNSLSTCALALPQRKIDANKLLVTALQNSMPGDETFYSGINKLFGTQLVQIDTGNRTFTVERIPESADARSWHVGTVQEAVDKYSEEVRFVFRQLTAVGPIGLFGTGGMDSRTILAALLDQQNTPQVMYGVGNNSLTDFDFSDLDLAKRVAERHGLVFQQLDWSGDQPYHEEKLIQLFQRYGFQYEIYGSPQSFLKALDGGISPYPALLLGGYSPGFTSAKPWDSDQTRFTLDDLINDGLHPQARADRDRCVIGKSSYRSTFAAGVKSSLEWAGIDYPDTHASLEMFVKAKLFLLIRAESRLLNLVNEFGNYIAPFLTKKLYDPLVDIPLKFRSKDEFQLRLIDALQPDLLDFPFCSSYGLTRANRKTFQLIRDQVIPKKSFAKRVVGLISNPVLRASAKMVISPFKPKQDHPAMQLRPRDPAIIAAYGHDVMNDPLGREWLTSTASLTPKELTRIRHYLNGINTLGYSDR